MQVQWGKRVIAYPLSTSPLKGVSSSGRFIPGNKPRYHYTGGWVAPDPVWTDMDNRKQLATTVVWTTGRPTRCQSLTEHPIPASNNIFPQKFVNTSACQKWRSIEKSTKNSLQKFHNNMSHKRKEFRKSNGQTLARHLSNISITRKSHIKRMLHHVHVI